jgi:acyl-CoA synthetase (NDP forming)
LKEHDKAHRRLETVLRPRSVAIVGASDQREWPRDIFQSCVAQGFPGDIFLVNPRQKVVYGRECYQSLRALPHPVDHAIIIVPASAVPSVLTDAHVAGIQSATIYAGGVGDGSGETSKQLGQTVRKIIRETGIRVAGPNCMGAMSFRERFFAYPNAALARLIPGSVGCVFQSGGTLQFFMATAATRGLRFSYGISSGNEFDIDLADYINFLIDDEETRQIVLFIEGIRRSPAFLNAAGRALEASKPILAIKTGATMLSAQAAASHTGAVAGDYSAYLAMCDRYGIVNCRTLSDLLESTLAFTSKYRPRGPKVGWVTTSGGTVDLLYDYSSIEDLPLASFSEETGRKLTPLMQDNISPKNPLDAGIPGSLDHAVKLCREVANDPDVDMVAWAAQLPSQVSAWSNVQLLNDFVGSIDKPMVGFARMPHQLGSESLIAQERAGFPFLQGLPETCRALNNLWFHSSRAGQQPSRPAQPMSSNLCRETLSSVLADYGIRSPRCALVPNAYEAASAADVIGYPVALKINSRDILHKTEAGGVSLHLKSAGEVHAAAEKLLLRASAYQPNATIDGFIVQEMVAGVETIVGAHEDESYGPILALGSGGVMVELYQDIALKLLPVDEAEIDAALRTLKLEQILSGFRGSPACDRKALVDTAVALARFFLEHRSVLSAIEINPLIVLKEGRGACAVDIRAVWR